MTPLWHFYFSPGTSIEKLPRNFLSLKHDISYVTWSANDLYKLDDSLVTQQVLNLSTVFKMFHKNYMKII